MRLIEPDFRDGADACARDTELLQKQFALEKQQKNMLDFSDVEHYALRVLVDPVTKELTETALEYQQQYQEVMIDEYQDSNYVQETLLTAVSGVKNGEGKSVYGR
ncbi:MAG: UvrD-helicase domain-containing protein [Eubacterium ramulus]